MAYIGKSPSTKFSAAAKIDTFTGDGSTVAFDLANIIPAGGENGLQVFVNNVRQKPGASNAFTVGNDGSGDLKRITFTEAPAASDEIYVITTFEATNITEIGDGTVTTAKLAADAVTSAKIVDGAIVNADINASAAIADSKLATITTASKVNVSALSAPGSTSLFLRGDRSYAAIPTEQIDTNAFNISLLGFKMAVNEGLTVFNLVDGIVDEFHDESGTDEAEGSNDTYCASNDLYQNISFSPATYSAGFTTTAVTESDTSTAGTNPHQGRGTFAGFTVPTGMTALNVFAWGGGGASGGPGHGCNRSGGGGFATGTLAVTPGQSMTVVVAEGGTTPGPLPSPVAGSGPTTHNGGAFGGYRPDPEFASHGNQTEFTGGGGGRCSASPTSGYVRSGGGLSGLFTNTLDNGAPVAAIVAGGGGAGEYRGPGAQDNEGGPAGGQQADAGGGPGGEQTSACGNSGGGGSQTTGGQGGPGTGGTAEPGGLFYGGNNAQSSPSSNQVYGAGGGAGYYGGGGGAWVSGRHGSSGGGSSFFGHPQVTSGSTTAAAQCEGGGVANPNYVACTNEGAPVPQASASEDGYMLLTGAGCTPSPGATTAIVSNAFTASSVPTTSRIVVFQENVDTPTLNTDIIASISRDGGSNFTTATLTDSGYVTGSSGQRILTGQATISGQPSGQSMRWKLALANNTVKIHGVSLQWA